MNLMIKEQAIYETNLDDQAFSFTGRVEVLKCSALPRCFCRGPMIPTKSGHCVFWPLATREGSGRSDMRLTETNKTIRLIYRHSKHSSARNIFTIGPKLLKKSSQVMLGPTSQSMGQAMSVGGVRSLPWPRHTDNS